MKLLELETQCFAGLSDGRWDFSVPGQGRPRPLTIVVGARASGKTSLLEAIALAKEAIGAYGNLPRPQARRARGAVTGLVRATFALEPDEQAAAEAAEPRVAIEVDLSDGAALPRLDDGMRKLFERFAFEPSVPKLEYFADNRELTAGDSVTDAKAEARLRTGRRLDKYAALLPAIAELSARDGAGALAEASQRGVLFGDDRPDALRPYRDAMAELVPELRLAGAHTSRGSAAERVTFTTKAGDVVTAAQLSAGQRQGILVAGTIVRLGLQRSLILVDQPELHLHAADHESFLRGLERLTGDSQLIVATGSSAISQMGSREQTIVLRRATPA